MKKIIIVSTLSLVIAMPFTSCKFFKSKFAQKQEAKDSFLLALDSMGANDIESNAVADAGSVATAIDNSSTPSSTTSTTNNATNDIATTNDLATTPKPTENTNKVYQTTTEPSTVAYSQVTRNRTSASTPSITSANTTAKKSTSTTTETHTQTAVPTYTGGRSASIYDGINDRAERAIVRKAEGYNDTYYVDDYDGSNTAYEKRYLAASDLGNGTPKSAFNKNGSRVNTSGSGIAADVPTTPTAPTTKTAETPKPASASRMGDRPKEVKPKSAADMTSKRPN